MAGATGVRILGGCQSDFDRNSAREGHDFAALTAKLAGATQAAARVDAGEDGVLVRCGVYGSETAMAPRVGATGEDDGYLGTLTTDMNADASYCLVFDAARVGDGPVCKFQLPERISSGTHSTWAPGAQLRRWDITDSAADAIGL